MLQVGGGVIAGLLTFLAVAAGLRMQELTLITEMVRARIRR
jgi:hypothetical protein